MAKTNAIPAEQTKVKSSTTSKIEDQPYHRFHGKPSEMPVGATRVSANGYHYTKIANSNWRLTHHLIAEEKFGRPIRYGAERVIFIDKDRTNLDPANIEIKPVAASSNARAIANLRARIAELQAQLEDLEKLEQST